MRQTATTVKQAPIVRSAARPYGQVIPPYGQVTSRRSRGGVRSFPDLVVDVLLVAVVRDELRPPDAIPGRRTGRR
jgi:hypothetical protein